jgi:hypothetical protein
VTEGGYDLKALAASLDGAIDALHAPPGPAAWPQSGVASDRGRTAVAQTQAALRPFWRWAAD